MENNFNNYAKHIISGKMKTVFIAAIAAFEEEFGDEFGFFKDEKEELSEYESEMYDKFERVRKRILDIGNKESREVSELLDNCRVDLVKGYIVYKGKKNGKV